LKKTSILIYSSMLLATILGVYGQRISYYLPRVIGEMSPLYYLTILTVVSFLLFWASPIFVYKLTKNIEKKSFATTIGINCFIGIPVSAWSFFVLVMWWG